MRCMVFTGAPVSSKRLSRTITSTSNPWTPVHHSPLLTPVTSEPLFHHQRPDLANLIPHLPIQRPRSSYNRSARASECHSFRKQAQMHRDPVNYRKFKLDHWNNFIYIPEKLQNYENTSLKY